MKPKHFFRQLVLSLVLLLVGVSPVFAAWEYERNGLEDEGGGTYNFRIENQYFTYRGESYDASHLDWFRTNNKFDVAKDQFYFEFEMRVCCDMIIDNDHFMNMLTGDSELENTLLEGEVYVVTSDDVSHLIGNWRKKKTDWRTVSYETLDGATAPFVSITLILSMGMSRSGWSRAKRPSAKA